MEGLYEDLRDDWYVMFDVINYLLLLFSVSVSCHSLQTPGDHRSAFCQSILASIFWNFT